jgi:N-acetylglucosaminyldiphosphoundecaprenol N-acetyl-beta-D-mannosaminyltransferase
MNQSSQRISLLNVPVDILAPEQLADRVFQLLAAGKGQNIVLLSLWDLLWARRNSEYGQYVRTAALVIPISKSIIRGIRFLHGKDAARYMPFEFVINLLGTLEKRELSAYLLGCSKQILFKAERNIRQTFPKLLVVGRYSNFFKRQEEPMITEAIRKASPSLLLVGKGVRSGERWIAKNNDNLSNGMRLWCSDLFEVFAEKKKHPSKAVFDRGLEFIGYSFQKPYKFFRVFLYIYYNLLLVINKLFVK